MEQKPRKRGASRKGIPNKVTKGVKDNILDVFERIGGVKNFAAWAQENQTEFYRHYAKLLPLDINASVSGHLTIIVDKTV